MASADSAELRIKLRPLSLTDIDRVCELEKKNLPVPWNRQQVEGEFQKPVSILVGIEKNSKLIGYIISNLVADELHILSLCIDKGERRNGYATLLIMHLFEIAIDQGGKSVWLEVRKSNVEARLLYQRLDFLQHSVRFNYYSDNGEDAVILNRALP